MTGSSTRSLVTSLVRHAHPRSTRSSAVARSSVNVTSPTGEPKPAAPAGSDSRKIIFFDIDNCLCEYTSAISERVGGQTGWTGWGLTTRPSGSLGDGVGIADSKQCGIEKQMKYLIGAYFRKVRL